MKRNIVLINLYTVFNNILFLLPIVVLYYKSVGLSFQEFLLGEAVFSAVVLLAEVPTGWMSDVWSRKKTLMVGLVSSLIGYGGLLFIENFWQAVLCQGVIGIGVAMNSGTINAVLYDTLKQMGREDEYRRLEGRRHAFVLYAVAFGAVCGGLAFGIHPKLPLILDVGVLFLALGSVALMVEPARSMKPADHHPLRDIVRTMRYALHGHQEIAGIIMVSTVIFCSTRLMLWAQQPYYAQLGLPPAWLGVIMAGSFILGGAAGHASHRIEHWTSNRGALLVMAATLVAACLILAETALVWIAVPMFLTGTLIFGMGMPRVTSAINSHALPERRATILSTASVMVHVLFIPSSMVAGAVEEHVSVQASLIYIAAQIVLLGGAGFWLWGRKRRLK